MREILEVKQQREEMNDRNVVNHAASVCVRGYRVTYLTAQRWLEQNLSELNSTGQTDSLCRSCSLCLAFLGFCYLALTLLNGYKKFISAYLHETSGRTQTKTIVPTFHLRHSFNLIGFELQLR